MKARITIPEPCHADWNGMQPNEKGRHCELCALTVVDFTDWDLSDIADYLRTNAGKKVCGRFQAEQINESFDLKVFAPQIINWRGSIFRKIAALIVICFAIGSSGCYMGETSEQPAELSGDTVMVEPSAHSIAPATRDTAAASATITPTAPKKKKKTRVVREEGVEPSGYTTMGAPMLETEREVMPAPPVKDVPKFQPPVGPPEDDGKMNQNK